MVAAIAGSAGADFRDAALQDKGIRPIPLNRDPRPCPGPDEPACIQALCIDCSNFSTEPSLTTPMQPAARCVLGLGWRCVEFHGANVQPGTDEGKPLPLGGGVATSSVGRGLAR